MLKYFPIIIIGDFKHKHVNKYTLVNKIMKYMHNYYS